MQLLCHVHKIMVFIRMSASACLSLVLLKLVQQYDFNRSFVGDHKFKDLRGEEL